MVSPAPKGPAVTAANDAFQRGDRSAWSSLSGDDAELFDDGSPRSVGGRTHRLDVGQVALLLRWRLQ